MQILIKRRQQADCIARSCFLSILTTDIKDEGKILDILIPEEVIKWTIKYSTKIILYISQMCLKEGQWPIYVPQL